MEQELIQTLQSDDIHFRMVGVQVAWSQGWGTMDIFKNLKPKVKQEWAWGISTDEKKTYQVGPFYLIIDFIDMPCQQFTIGYKREKLHQCYANSKGDYKRIFKMYSQYFMEYLLEGAEN